MTFAQGVYVLCKQVPRGRVTTYGEIAKALNSKAYRAVGAVLRCNPYAPVVPCHRVVGSDGRIGGFMGESEGKAVEKKVRLLAEEGVRVVKGRVVDFEDCLFCF